MGRKNPKYALLTWLIFALFLGPLCLVEGVTNSTESSVDPNGILQVVETEVWDASTDSWKAETGARWTSERGQPSPSPSEIKPPEGFAFDGDWKIVVSGGDAMGWEYSFTYLQSPSRRRVWLRSLKRRKRPPPPPAIPKSIPATSSLTNTLKRIQDDWNFKGFGVTVYKSVIFPSSFGVQMRLPLTMNFDWWDRHPELPSVSTSVAILFPFTIAAFISTSVHVEWVKWVLMSVLLFIPRIIALFVYRILLPILWSIGSAFALSFTSSLSLPSMPKMPTFAIAKPKYNPELSERVGCSLSVRWSTARGLEQRCSYWHSYLPTFSHYREFLRANRQVPAWWQKRFGSFGVQTGYPIPDHPNFSCSAQLSLSGLYFRNTQQPIASESLASSAEAAVDSAKQAAIIEKVGQEMQRMSAPPPPPEPIVSTKLLTKAKTSSS